MVTGKKYATIGSRGVLLLGIATASILCGCSTQRSASVDANQISSASASAAHNQGYTAPGVVNYVWEEPMVNVVEVPPGLDPEGIYYRPAHQEVVEVRQGKWKYYKDQTAEK